jgi:predicted alpha/beta superfamily hydrolase
MWAMSPSLRWRQRRLLRRAQSRALCCDAESKSIDRPALLKNIAADKKNCKPT